MYWSWFANKQTTYQGHMDHIFVRLTSRGFNYAELTTLAEAGDFSGVYDYICFYAQAMPALSEKFRTVVLDCFAPLIEPDDPFLVEEIR